MDKNPFEPYVMIPYKELMELLDLPRQLQRVEKEPELNKQQYQLLRTQYVEVLMRLRELEYRMSQLNIKRPFGYSEGTF